MKRMNGEKIVRKMWFILFVFLFELCFVNINLVNAQNIIEVQAKNFISTEFLSHNRIEQIKKTGILTGDGEATYGFTIPETGWYEFYVAATQWPTSIYLDGKFLIYTVFKSGVWKTKEQQAYRVMNLYLEKGHHQMTFSRTPFPGLPYMSKFFFEKSNYITGKVRLIFKKDYMVFKKGGNFPTELFVGESSQPTNLNITITNVQSNGILLKKEISVPSGTNNYQKNIDLPTNKEGVFDIKLTSQNGKPCDREYEYVVIDTHEKIMPAKKLKKKLIYTLNAAQKEPDYSNGETKAITTPFGSYRESGDIGREKGMANADWFAYTMHLPSIQHLYLLKIQYPDDDERTCEITMVEKYLQDPPSLGYVTGGLYPLTNKMQTLDFYFYPTQKNPRLLFYNWTTGQRAAVGKIYVYRITGGLPVLQTKNSKRLYGTYQEEPFRIVNWYGAMPNGNGWLNLLNPIERKAQLSAYSGINLWDPTIAVYQCMLWPGKTLPGYQIGALPAGPFTLKQPFKQDLMRLMLLVAEKYHIKFIGELSIPPNWVLAMYLDKKFGGTGSIKNNGYQKPWLTVSNTGQVGTGLTNPYESSYLNPVYPGVQEWVESVVKEIAERYKNIPSFAGISLRLFPDWVFGSWDGWANIKWGYDDYTINLFEKETGIKIPVSNTNPQRFEKRYNWLMANAHKKWIDWRCEKMEQYYNKLAKILTNARKGLKLYVTIYPSNSPSVFGEKWIDIVQGEGIDPRLYVNNPSIVLEAFKTYPAGRLSNSSLTTTSAGEIAQYFNPSPIISISKQKGSGTISFVHLDAASFEGQLVDFSALGYTKQEILPGQSQVYPAGVLNPSGRNYLERFANAMADGNMVFIDDGSHGYTLGQPEYLREFLSEYRTLPDIGMNLLPGSEDPVALWYGQKDTKTYFYIVNRLDTKINVSVSFAQKPSLKRLSENKNIDINGTTFTTRLLPYQMISYESDKQPISIKTKVPETFVETIKKQLKFVKNLFIGGHESSSEGSFLDISPIEFIKAKKTFNEAKKEFILGHLWETRNLLVSKDMVKLYETFHSYPPSLFYIRFPRVPESVMTLTPEKIMNLVSLKDKKKIKIECGGKISYLLSNENVLFWKGEKIHLQMAVPFSDFYRMTYSYPKTKTYSAPLIYVNGKKIESKIPAWGSGKWREKTIEPVLLKQGIVSITLIKQKDSGLFFLSIKPIYRDITSDEFYAIGPFKPLKNPDNLKDVVRSLNYVLPPEKWINLKGKYSVMNGRTAGWSKPETGMDSTDPNAKNFIDFYKTFGVLGNVINYAVTYIKSPTDRKAQLSVGFDYWSKIWLNGKVIKKPEIRPAAPPVKGEEKINVRLKKGINILLIKVYSGSAGNGFWCSISDPGDLRFMGKTKMKNYPSIELSNGVIKCRVYLPDAKNGFYRGSRFDWSGLIGRVEYKNHRFFGPWWPKTEKRNPKANDQVVGPAGEFGMGIFNMPAPLGYNEAKIGGEFLKIGVGIEKKPASDVDPKTKKAIYRFGYNYEIIKPIPWTIKTGKTWVSCTQKVKDFKGYGYIYTHKISLVKDKPEFIDQYSITNIGKKKIYQEHYAHNFISIDNQPVGPDYELTFPFKPELSPPSDFLKTEKNKMLFIKPLNTELFTVLKVFKTGGLKNTSMIVKNIKTGAGIKITNEKQTVIRYNFFATPKAVCPEPFINVKISPGQKIQWQDVYTFFTEK